MKNMSGDTVIGEQAVSDCTTSHVWYPSVAAKSILSLFFFVVAFADGSNSFLKISSHSGGIDVYVGDGGSAEIHTQEGKRTVFLPAPYVESFSTSSFPHSSVVHRSGVCARPLLAESWRGTLWSIGGYQPRGCSA